MKIQILFVLNILPLAFFCQATIEGKWKLEHGVSTMSNFNKSSAFNLRYISPKFRWSDDDLTEEQEKHAELYNKTRIMFDLIYSPTITNFCVGMNVQYRIFKYKLLSLESSNGIKFFFIRGDNFAIKRPFIKGSSNGVWY